FDRDALLTPVAADLGHVHRVTERRERVEPPRHFGAHLVASFPDPLGKPLDEERHLAIAQLLVHGDLAARVARRIARIREPDGLLRSEEMLDLARLELDESHGLAALLLDRFETSRLQVLEEEVLEIVLALDREQDLDALAALHVAA